MGSKFRVHDDMPQPTRSSMTDRCANTNHVMINDQFHWSTMRLLQILSEGWRDVIPIRRIKMHELRQIHVGKWDEGMHLQRCVIMLTTQQTKSRRGPSING